MLKTTPADITYEVTANGNTEADTATLTFTFSEAVAELKVEEITISGDGVKKGALSSAETFWTLGITASAA